MDWKHGVYVIRTEWTTIQHSLHIRPQYMALVIHDNNYISNPVSVVKNEIPQYIDRAWL